jgi:hypothetical protein
MQRAELATFLLDQTEKRQNARTIVGLAAA